MELLSTPGDSAHILEAYILEGLRPLLKSGPACQPIRSLSYLCRIPRFSMKVFTRHQYYRRGSPSLLVLPSVKRGELHKCDSLEVLLGCVCHPDFTWIYISGLINKQGHSASIPQNRIPTTECRRKKGNRVTRSTHLCSNA